MGKGGGGEVFTVRDKYTRETFALKVLAARASSLEMDALVREAIALSGLEGLGVPRVVRFGRMPASGRPYLLRELVQGHSLERLIRKKGQDLSKLLAALARAAEQLTLLHRAGLLHGDVKPANIIVGPSGRSTLVDLGLSAPFRDSGTEAEGLTPKYAAPELLAGKPLTVRAEVYALGTALDEAVQAQPRIPAELKRELLAIVRRATAVDPADRHPSADEFAVALRRVARISDATERVPVDALWPIVGIESTSGRLLDRVEHLPSGATLAIVGPPGAGSSSLLRRLAWSLGIAGRPVVFIDEELVDNEESIEAELRAFERHAEPFILVDDADTLPAVARRRVLEAREQGARLVGVGTREVFAEATEFDVPPLDRTFALDLVRRSIPSVTERVLGRIVDESACRPGELRRLVRMLANEALASESDVVRVLKAQRAPAESILPSDPLARLNHLLDRGRYTDAERVLQEAPELSDRTAQLIWAVLRARLELGKGEAARALRALDGAAPLVNHTQPTHADKSWNLYTARAHVGTGDYTGALTLIEPLCDDDALGAEASAYKGLALSYLGRQNEALDALMGAVSRARAAASARVEAIASAGLGLVLQRADRLEEAQKAYREAIDAAERASDAGTLATVQLNIAGLLKIAGDIAGAIEHFEAAVDMGKRSGRLVTLRQALLNLANTDLYLGRLSRAQASIESLLEQKRDLPPEMVAQLLGLEAELCARSGRIERAEQLFEECANAYELLGRGLDMAEARLERVVTASRLPNPALSQLRAEISRAETALGDSSAHRPLLLLASARVARLANAEVEARTLLDEALRAARTTGQREWVWRALEARAELAEASGQALLARRDREEALVILEEIAARLPRDLREVYWNEPRRRQLRTRVSVALAVPIAPVALSAADSGLPLERRLSRILEVNRELAGEYDVERLTAKIIDHAVDLLRAERGFLLLVRPDGTLSVHTSRSRLIDDPHLDFSKSIAAQVIETAEPVVSLSARDDARMNAFPSVHQMMLQSVACIPILAPDRRAIGALYLETRLRRGAQFEAELETLRAFGDQVAIALENARLITENNRRAEALAESNRALADAQRELRELLEERTLDLKRTRRRLRETRDTLFGHFGYLGLVGTSAAMRQVYALIDRVKDTDVPVLITGESGTGKEVVARAIHSASPRSKGKFLGVNCGAIPEHLLEAELFGHVRGAYTGADRDRKGLFREAAQGSILLDEIGEMPQKMQAGLLRVLQDRCVRPVGGTSEEPVDVRLIFATNRDLAALVAEKKFREDLYYRIHVVELKLPALRERAEDIPQLVDHFLGIFAARYRRERKSLSREAMRSLCSYSWPGNVRQLEHVLLNAWVLSDESEIESQDLDLPSSGRPREARAPATKADSRPISRSRGSERSSRHSTTSSSARRRSRLSQHRRDERERILKALQACNWNRVKAAEMSGIPRRTFYRRLREYGIQ